MQTRNIRKRHGAWHLRYYVTELVDGHPVRRQVTRRLAPINDDYRSPKDLKAKVAEILDPLNDETAAPEGRMTLAAFADSHFLPHVLAKRKRSTHKFYRDVINNHLRASVGHLRLEDFRTVHAQRVLDSISLSLASLQRIKTGMSAIFSHAARLGFVSGANPVHQAKPEGTRSDTEPHAYTTEEVLHMLATLEEPAKTVVAAAAFTGLRESELRGLQWADYDGTYLHVRRSVWRTHIGTTKTPASKARVPVIGPLRKLLEAHKQRPAAGVWIFSGDKKGFSLSLDNLAARSIKPNLGERWKGWKPFRSGLATVLFGLGVPAETAKIILRHSDANTTRRHYILLKSQNEGVAAMQQLENALANVGQVRASGKKAKSRKSRQSRMDTD